MLGQTPPSDRVLGARRERAHTGASFARERAPEAGILGAGRCRQRSVSRARQEPLVLTASGHRASTSSQRLAVAPTLGPLRFGARTMSRTTPLWVFDSPSGGHSTNFDHMRRPCSTKFGTNSTDSCPNSGKLGPTLAWSRPKLARGRSNSARSRPISTNIGQAWLELGPKRCPNSAKHLARTRPETRIGPRSAKLGPNSTKIWPVVDRLRPTLARDRPKSARCRPILANFEMHWQPSEAQPQSVPTLRPRATGHSPSFRYMQWGKQHRLVQALKRGSCAPAQLPQSRAPRAYVGAGSSNGV